ncbi:TlpA disulfide reductase family protein [Pelagerythrobacter marensis]|uniref:TlpA disulfide reductase family protein n=1 Tax=Pelagerythrobacter marensis TaxID=543877 RepID=A0ABZ2D2L9_9SPHN
MSFLSSFRLSFTCVALALVLAGCDRQAPEAAQGEGASAEDKAGLAGIFDRSHAGDLMPAIEVVDPDGETFNLAAAQGTPVLLNLWATWCAPCVKEMPQLDDLAGEYGDSLRVVTVSQDMGGAEKVRPFFASMGFDHLEPWMEPDLELGFALESQSLPTTVLYDASGREVWRVVGEHDWSGADVREAIAEAVD